MVLSNHPDHTGQRLRGHRHRLVNQNTQLQPARDHPESEAHDRRTGATGHGALLQELPRQDRAAGRLARAHQRQDSPPRRNHHRDHGAPGRCVDAGNHLFRTWFGEWIGE